MQRTLDLATGAECRKGQDLSPENYFIGYVQCEDSDPALWVTHPILGKTSDFKRLRHRYVNHV